MGAEKQNGVVNYNRRPPHRTFWEKVRYGIYNPEEGTYLGRTPHRWGVIGLIYLVMYICIIIFFSICMCGLLATMDEKIPYFKLADSIIGDNPGMGHRPLIFEDQALIWYKASNASHVKKYVDNINQFLAPYKNNSLLPGQGINQIDCGKVQPPREKVCSFDVSLLGPCTEENDYGYAEKQPCIIVKLNKLYDWYPQFYDDPNDLPESMPQDLKDHITKAAPEERRKVWVSCEGERPGDNETIGPVEYYPYPGLPETYFPYDNTDGYLSPIVAAKLMGPTLHQIINIHCRAWARNIKHTPSLKDRFGSTHLEIMIDDD